MRTRYEDGIFIALTVVLLSGCGDGRTKTPTANGGGVQSGAEVAALDPMIVSVPPALLQEINAARPAASVFLTPIKSPLKSLADLGGQGIVALEINPAKDKGEELSLFALKFTMICSTHDAVPADSDGRVGFQMIPSPDVFVSGIISPPKLVVAWDEDKTKIGGAREVRFVAQQQ